MWLESIKEEHLHEASFLWERWEALLHDARLTLTDVAVIEERLLAHLDGLMLGGESVALLWPALEGEDPGEVFTAAFVTLEQAPPRALDAILERLTTAPRPVKNALGRALESSLGESWVPLLLARLGTLEAPCAALSLDVLASRRAARPELAFEWLSHPDASVVASALRILATSTTGLPPGELSRWLADPRPEVHWEAVRCGLQSGSRTAWSACREVARGSGPYTRQALVLLALAGEDADLRHLLTLTGDEKTRAEALWALGFSGHRAAAEACLELCGQPAPVARLAAEAFAAITGVTLEGPHVAPTQDEDALPPLDEEDLDESLVPRPEDSLPVPVYPSLAGWWRDARKGFAAEVRYLGGKPFDEGALLSALSDGPMRRRPVHSLELALRTRGAHVVHPFAFTRRQSVELAAARSARSRMPLGPLARLDRE